MALVTEGKWEKEEYSGYCATLRWSPSIEQIKIDKDKQLPSTSEKGEIAYVSSQVMGDQISAVLLNF